MVNKLSNKNKQSLRGKSEWREYFRDNGKKITKKRKHQVLQYVKRRAKQAMDDLVLISKGLHYLTDDLTEERAKKHRTETFPMPLTGICWIKLVNETKHCQIEIQKLLKEEGKKTIFEALGYSISQLKMKKSMSSA